MDWIIIFIICCFVIALLVLIAVAVILFTSLPPHKKFSFEGKHAFVTGGSKGIGKAISLALIRRGCSVSIAARDENALEATCSELRKLADLLGNGAVANWFVLDVTRSYEQTKSVIDSAEEKIGPVDILINNAGNSVQDAFEELPVEQFEKQMRLNYLSAVFATRAVVPSMKLRGSGHIAFVSSAAAQFAIYGYTAYGPSKFAVRGLAEALHMELLPYGIGVSILYPPNTETEGFQEELRTMPAEVREISSSGGLFEPSTVAERALSDIAKGNFSTSIGLEGWMLSTLSAGAAPEHSFLRSLQQVLLAGIFRLVALHYVANFNDIVKKHKVKKQ